MAEFVFRDMLVKRGLESRLWAASAATSAEELGNPIYPPARRKLESEGIACSGKTARQVAPEDYSRFALIAAMDGDNLRALRRVFGGDPEGKLHKLLAFCGETGDVADPWYTRDFDAAWRDIRRGCEALLEKLLKEDRYLCQSKK